VNKVETAVRMRHLPSGIMVVCRAERSQHQNRHMAMKMLKAKLYEMEMAKREEAQAVGRGVESAALGFRWSCTFGATAWRRGRCGDLAAQVPFEVRQEFRDVVVDLGARQHADGGQRIVAQDGGTPGLQDRAASRGQVRAQDGKLAGDFVGGCRHVAS